MKLGLKHSLHNLPHGVALIKISQGTCLDVDEFYGVFFRGDFIDGKHGTHDAAMLCFWEMCRSEGL
jgi:hypothetical protein